jgi:hypothetical protein
MRNEKLNCRTNIRNTFTAFKNLTLASKDDTASGCHASKHPKILHNHRHYNQQNTLYLGEKPLTIHSEETYMFQVSGHYGA